MAEPTGGAFQVDPTTMQALTTAFSTAATDIAGAKTALRNAYNAVQTEWKGSSKLAFNEYYDKTDLSLQAASDGLDDMKAWLQDFSSKALDFDAQSAAGIPKS